MPEVIACEYDNGDVVFTDISEPARVLGALDDQARLLWSSKYTPLYQLEDQLLVSA